MTPPSRDSETGLPQKKRYGATPTESVAQPWGRRELIVVGLVCGAFALALACASGAVGARIDDAATMTANLAGLDPVPACPSGAPEDQTYSDMHRTLSCKCPDDKTWMQPNLNKAQDGTICPVSADGSGACNWQPVAWAPPTKWDNGWMKPGKKLPSIPRVSEPKDLLEPVVCCPKDQYLIAPPGHHETSYNVDIKHYDPHTDPTKEHFTYSWDAKYCGTCNDSDQCLDENGDPIDGGCRYSSNYGGLCAPKTCPRDDLFLSKLMRLTCCRLGIGGSPYDGSHKPKDASKCEESFDCEYCTIGKDDIHSSWGKPGKNFYFYCTPASSPQLSGCAL
mmetsp:Transcript_22191/g.69490  ORF Transcript_22191/g.69490 Transcript_22191/m.69490 type:complete len:335 (+) Transcript_22191:1043-2047(+)